VPGEQGDAPWLSGTGRAPPSPRRRARPTSHRPDPDRRKCFALTVRPLPRSSLTAARVPPTEPWISEEIRGGSSDRL